VTDYSDLVSRLFYAEKKLCSPTLLIHIEAKEAEIDFWKNRTREALETIKDNISRIAELRQLIARIIEHNHIDSDVTDYIRWEKLVADARKSLENAAADWEASHRALGEKEDYIFTEGGNITTTE